MKKCINLSIGTTTITKRPDTDPDVSYLDQDGFESRRKEYENGHFGFIGIIVRTELIGHIDTNPGKYFEMSDNVITSLWGIESDSGKDHIEEIIQEMKSENKSELLKMGFSSEEIDQSLNNAETKEEW